jgi:VWFA-related protein
LVGGLAVSAQQPPVFRGAGEAVRVFVTVMDHDGRLVTTLSQNDFEVRDEGRPQPITLFDNTPKPIRLIVMLDVSGSMEGNLPLLRGASDQLFARLRPNDVVRVGTFGRDIVINPSTFTRDPDELRRALPTSIAPDAPTPLWRALDQAMDALKGDAEERPVIPRPPRGRDGIRDRDAQPQPPADAAGHRSRWSAGDAQRGPAGSRVGSRRGTDRRRLHRNPFWPGSRRRVRARR